MTLLQQEPATNFAAPGKIVVATDLSDMDYLLPHALAQAKASGASLVLVHTVVLHEAMPVETGGAFPYYDPLRMDRDARLQLDNVAREVREQGVECTTAVRHGFVPDIVTDVVRNVRAGRLILGTHGRRGLKKFVLGSVARLLLETVEVPVCTVGPRAHKREATGGTILHPVSLAGMHEKSASLSLRLGEQCGAQVVLLHVITPGPGVARDPGKAVAAATEQLNRLVPERARARTRVVVRVAQGNVVPEVLAVADEVKAGMIVLGVHAPAHSWLPGTEPAAYRILVTAPCPVLSLRVDPELAGIQEEHQEEVSPLAIG
jgi:nucleotide-binding universal stress UspA family protein